ncbi:MAG TPA: hypothetical protein VJT75_12035 [Thermoleophilaceae bacterium]|nr:hypothetical protein [Thermoleophilaceae bacterium]
MPGIAITMLVLVLIAAVVGGSLVIGAPVFAIPIIFLILVVWAGARIASHRDRPGIGDEDVPGEGVEFTERDYRTLTPREELPPAAQRRQPT